MYFLIERRLRHFLITADHLTVVCRADGPSWVEVTMHGTFIPQVMRHAMGSHNTYAGAALTSRGGRVGLELRFSEGGRTLLVGLQSGPRS